MTFFSISLTGKQHIINLRGSKERVNFKEKLTVKKFLDVNFKIQKEQSNYFKEECESMGSRIYSSSFIIKLMKNREKLWFHSNIRLDTIQSWHFLARPKNLLLLEPLTTVVVHHPIKPFKCFIDCIPEIFWCYPEISSCYSGKMKIWNMYTPDTSLSFSVLLHDVMHRVATSLLAAPLHQCLLRMYR